ncbi:MAG: NAD-dependent epimerase/dehydratase family protein [bacterium]
MPKPIFDKKNIIITGGAGFIGSHLAEQLIKENKVICIDNLITGEEQNIDYLLRFPDFKFINHDITQPIDLESIPELEKFKINFQGIQEIYHMACLSSPAAIDAHPIETSLANSLGTKNILDLAVKYNAKFLLRSSSCVYGLTPPNQDSTSESYVGPYDHLSARNAYIEGKKYAESLTKNYIDAYKIDAKIARVFNVYGPRMKMNDGRIMPDLIMKGLANEPMEIPGDENLKNSFCFVADLVEALIKFMETNEQGPINIGNPEAVFMADVAKKIKELTESTSEIVFTKEDKRAIKSLIPDITLAKEKIGWFPITLLDTGLKIIARDIRASEHLIGYYSK